MNTILDDLRRTAQELRRDALRLIYEGGDGHPGPALSVADIVTALYFHALKIDPARPDWPERDRFILSKGHACPVLYAALARKGYFADCGHPKLRALGSILQGHPDMNKTPGVDMTSGSLGNGLSIGLGMALAARYNQLDYRTYVVTGDGELQEGIVWEAAAAAYRYRASNLTVFVDHNHLQSSGAVSDVADTEPLAPKWRAFGWLCQEVDGHDIGQILRAAQTAIHEPSVPSVIICHTIKGKGVPFMENDNSWHKRVPTESEFSAAMASLEEGMV